MSGREFREKTVKQGRQFCLTIRELAPVSGITKGGEHFAATADSETPESVEMILSTGTTPIKLGLPGEDQFQGPGVSYCATRDGRFFADVDVVVVGAKKRLSRKCSRSRTSCARSTWFTAAAGCRPAREVLQERAFENRKMEFLWEKIAVRASGRDEA